MEEDTIEPDGIVGFLKCNYCCKRMLAGCFSMTTRPPLKLRKTCDSCCEKLHAKCTTQTFRDARKLYNARPDVKIRISQHNRSIGSVMSREKYKKTDKWKKVLQRHQKTDKRAASRARHRQTERYAATLKAYKASGRYAEVRAAEYKRVHSDPGRHMEHNIGTALLRMVKGIKDESTTGKMYTDFATRAQIVEHFEDLFLPGMTWENHGRYGWHIGHRIARFHFNPNIKYDVRRCWSKNNLFPQWGKENLKMQVKLPPDEELIKLKSVFPEAWEGKLPTKEERAMMDSAPQVLRWAGRV
jgi:hypothetical protein